ncbi:hypothetical protein BJP36_43470 [Moorena producens JHB]|uniref:Uncharacterized protein n=1 Tax=Moorena producens (strain JHB) TaxID=1454205 RepID=A0A9Q9ST84_MOOP1|nr:MULTISPECIES: hypothetical protein [Moorena]WAN69221.1 hypothetical protein BJP36_43470 [Moorena producens JHB]
MLTLDHLITPLFHALTMSDRVVISVKIHGVLLEKFIWHEFNSI